MDHLLNYRNQESCLDLLLNYAKPVFWIQYIIASKFISTSGQGKNQLIIEWVETAVFIYVKLKISVIYYRNSLIFLYVLVPYYIMIILLFIFMFYSIDYMLYSSSLRVIFNLLFIYKKTFDTQ